MYNFIFHFYFLYSDPDDFKILFNSACATTGNALAYIKNKTKKKPIVPRKIPISINVGENIVHDDGRKSRCNEVTIITKRSNHIPIFTKIDRINVATKDVLILYIQ
tara:strand:+ start:623 stop:940 length:318 start_codon:yes stop_codon:yes gene_type:complete